MFACKLKNMTYSNLLGADTCIALLLIVCSSISMYLCYVTVAMQIKEFN